jgi:hypothetical protein
MKLVLLPPHKSYLRHVLATVRNEQIPRFGWPRVPGNNIHTKFSDNVKLYENLMFCWTCIIVYRYNETNMMHFLFILLRIKSLYMLRALFAHPQEVLHKRHLVSCLRIMSVGCATIPVKLQSHIRTQYTKWHLCNASWRWASKARNT